MKRIKVSCAILMILSLIVGMVPSINVKAINALTDIDFQMPDRNTGEATQTGKATLTFLNYNYDSIVKEEYNIICYQSDEEENPMFWERFKNNVDAAYDVFMFAPWISKVYANWGDDINTINCSLTVPCPNGYDPSTAKLLFAMSTDSTDKVAVTSSTDSTFTINVPIGVSSYMAESPAYYSLSDHWFIELHKHTPSATWSSDANTHWHACTSNDGKKLDEAAHTFDAGVKSGNKITYTCTVCGYQKTEDIKVSENEIVSDQSNEAEYKVTSVKDGEKTVEYEKSEKKDAKKINIPDTVTLPDGSAAKVTAVAAGALKGNKTVTNVTIGKNITSIGGNAFKGCSKLNKITIKSTKIKKIGKNAFKGIKKGATIKVPKSKKEAYTKLLKKAKLPAGVKIK